MILKKRKFFYIFFHLFLWTLIPSISNINLPLDTIEALAWGSNLDWGYSKHPPLVLLLSSYFIIFLAQEIGLIIFWSNICNYFFSFVWKFANEIFKDKIYSYCLFLYYLVYIFIIIPLRSIT